MSLFVAVWLADLNNDRPILKVTVKNPCFDRVASDYSEDMPVFKRHVALLKKNAEIEQPFPEQTRDDEACLTSIIG
jgi:hypothetical protein